MIVCGDIHFGTKINDDIFIEYQKNEFDKLLDYAIVKNIDTMIFLGDIFNNRQTINVKTLDLVCDKFKLLSKNGIKSYIIAGNHDVFYKNTNLLNTPRIILNNIENVTIIDNTPEIITIEGSPFLFVPWITKDNYDECIKIIKEQPTKYCLGHFEINDFIMNGSIKCVGGFDSKFFKEFDRVFSGHFHLKSSYNNIHYLGSLVQTTWNDFSDSKGFYEFDPKQDNLKFIEGVQIYEKIIINDKTNLDEFKDIADKYIKVYLNKKLDKKENLLLTDILKKSIAFELIDNTIIFDDDIIDIQDEDTKTVLKDVIDIQDFSDKIKDDMFNLINKCHESVLLEG